MDMPTTKIAQIIEWIMHLLTSVGLLTGSIESFCKYGSSESSRQILHHELLPNIKKLWCKCLLFHFYRSELIKVGENATKHIPVHSLKYNSEDHIRDYSALASLYLHYGLPVQAECTLRRIVKLRSEDLNFGPGHAETVLHLKMLQKSLKCQHKYKSAYAVRKRISRAGKLN